VVGSVAESEGVVVEERAGVEVMDIRGVLDEQVMMARGVQETRRREAREGGGKGVGAREEEEGKSNVWEQRRSLISELGR